MVLAQPRNQHVLKTFDLTGKVAVVTGNVCLHPWLGWFGLINLHRRCAWHWSRSLQSTGRSRRQCMYAPSLLPMARDISSADEPKVAIIYSSSKNAGNVAAEIASANKVRTAAYQADVSNHEQINGAIQKITTDFGKLDILVANSGIASHHAAEDYTTEQWREIMKVNLDGAFYSAQAAARIFKKQGFGNVIFTASVSATLVNVPQKQAAVREFHRTFRIRLRNLPV
jgi:sorbose reductase